MRKYERGDGLGVLVIIIILVSVVGITWAVYLSIQRGQAPCSELGNVPISDLPSRCLQNGVK